LRKDARIEKIDQITPCVRRFGGQYLIVLVTDHKIKLSDKEERRKDIQLRTESDEGNHKKPACQP
jgi:hypothetical protein